MSIEKDITSSPLDYDALKDAFARFGEASARLEGKYQVLMEETKMLREAVRQKDIEIKRQERLALLGETAAAIAHEVRNPLGSIKLFISLLRKDLTDRPDSLQLIDQVNTSIGALDHVVSNILQFSKEKALTVSPVNVHAVIQEQLLSFPRSDSNQANFELDLGASPFILANDGALRQVLYNLILNALQATEYRGRITIRTADVGAAHIEIRIGDNGPGVTGELVERIFEPFVTTKNEGTGLGLSIVKQIIEQHAGTIQCVSEVKKGAEFIIRLPRNFKEKHNES